MRTPLALIALLLVLAGLAAFWHSQRDNGADATLPAAPRVPSKSSPRTTLTPAEALPSLQAFRDLTPDSETRFEEIQRIVALLSNEEIKTLIHEIGLGKSPGYTSWLRSALFAEWASRDLDAALAYLRDPKTEGSMYDSCLQQSFYAIFRGSRPDDPEDALAHLNDLRNKRELGKFGNGIDWANHAFRLLFSELAAADSEQAWRLIPGSHVASPNNPFDSDDWFTLHSPSVRGLIEGLDNPELIADFAKRWHIAEFKPNKDLPTNPGSSFSYRASPNDTAALIASTWINIDPQAAIDWIRDDASTTPEIADSRIGQAFGYWAKQHPGEALAMLRNNEFPNYHSTIATNLIRANAHLAPELVQLPNPSFSLSDTFVGSITLNTMLEGEAQYPEPGRQNRPPDYEARQDSLRSAINTPSIFDARTRAGLIESVEMQFRD